MRCLVSAQGAWSAQTQLSLLETSLITHHAGTAYPINDAILDSFIGVKVFGSADCLFYLLRLVVCVLSK